MSTSQIPALSCALVGADSLLIECGEILLRKGHSVVAVAAGSPRVARWARDHSIALVDATAPTVQWQGDLARHEFEWLFAITHLAMLPDATLALASKGAVNFHDGPLPAYAGLNTPAWALLRGETEYGITWHTITPGLDEGDVLKQRRFEIAQAETSLSLNTRNFEAAIETFEELIDELATGVTTPTPQDATVPRQTFSRNDRPEALAVLDWSQPAAVLERTVRALDFGRYANPLGFAKVWNGTTAALVTAAELVDALDGGGATAGTIVESGDDRLIVQAGDGGRLALTGFHTLTGQPRSAAEIAAELGLDVGRVLPVLDHETRFRWTTLGRRLAVAERHHAAELEALEPVELAWAATPDTGHASHFDTIAVVVPATLDAGSVVGAFGVLLSRLSGKDRFHVALRSGPGRADFAAVAPFIFDADPLAIEVSADHRLSEAVDAITTGFDAALARAPLAAELIARSPELSAVPELVAGRLLPIGISVDVAGEPGAGVVLELASTAGQWALCFDDGLVSRSDAQLFATGLEAVVREVSERPDTVVAHVDLLGAELRRRVLIEWNDTATDVRADVCVHHLFEEQVDRTPDVPAVVFEDRSLTYRQLDERSNRLAWYLIELGIAPDQLVGVHVNRSIDLVVAVLAVQKAGGAYVPLDPAYPSDRLAHMIRDSRCRVIITDTAAEPTLPLRDDPAITVIRIDADRPRFDDRPSERPRVSVGAGHLAYCIYTSGSTGMPKGVLVEHRNVVNFFVGMDDRVPHDLPSTWFAVTSLSFDISVLELSYTLTRGFTVVVYVDRDRAADETPTGDGAPIVALAAHSALPMDFSLFYFSGDEAENSGSDKYRLLLEGARWGDEHGFRAVWTPERHFHAFGGLYPQPAVTGAAIAAITKNIGIRAGSVVMPLSHPIRVAEAWSVVDNLSDGRVAISFASGWQPNDFVLMPQNYATAKQAMFDGIDAVKRLWRGEKVGFPGATGTEVEVTTLPRPVQPELPVWVTTAGNPDTYVQAGRIGANVLTHLLGQTVEQLAPKIAAYRSARAEAGFDPAAGVVSLMLHTFVGEDDDSVRAIVREPLKQYLGTSFSLLKEYAWAFPAFARPANATTENELADDDFKNLSADDLDAVLEFAYLRYYESSGLFGTPERCRTMVDQLKGIGVNEIACLVDFGVATDTVLASLPTLDVVRRQSNTVAVGDAPSPEPTPATAVQSAPGGAIDQSVAAQLGRHGVTHLQCTPSMARMLSMQDESRAALADVEHVFVGGEAFPVALAQDLRAASRSGNITNMYGPTETTIWSTTWTLGDQLDLIPIGTPIANTQIYILDAHRQPVPPGVAGELWIGGDGVVRGYHDRPELTAERFVTDPFRGAPHRMYLTGDLARWRQPDQAADATRTIRPIVEFLGRTDHQVKIRGYRIELGEIEAQLGTYPGVRECVVMVREETPGDQQLVGYVSATNDAIVESSAVRGRLRQHLPDVMVPAHIAVLDELPHTPNGKIDRHGLPSLAEVLGGRSRSEPVVEATNDLERQVLTVWEETLGTTRIGVDDNFFDIGGHSLLVVRMHRRIKDTFDTTIPLTDLYRYPTVRGLAASLANMGGSTTVQAGVDRAAKRRARSRR